MVVNVDVNILPSVVEIRSKQRNSDKEKIRREIM